ncbi:hypothetical protein JYU34_015008 [Plutella xylostella]|uniref:Uncharacterized protein n=1 Tax=Plutella xylostella TaxID=51655 RepID=A0ABQ7Q9R6_PLUXY|nr:hypothetical protein JYU34_015008 [Plutella xylostella]
MDIQEVNKLIKSQENDSNELRRILSNIKKDSTLRKIRPEYIDDRRKVINDVFVRTQQHDDRLKEQELLSTHKYITLNYFDNNIKKYYNEAMDYLHQCEQRLQDVQKINEQETATHSDATANLNTLNDPKIFIQQFRISQLSKKLSQAKIAITEEKPQWRLKSLFQSIQNQWQEIEGNHLELLVTENALEHDYFTSEYFDIIQRDYELTCELIEEKMNTSNEASTTVCAPSSSRGKLPPIKIPQFTGSYDS